MKANFRSYSAAVCSLAILLSPFSLVAQDQPTPSRAATVLDSMPRAKRISQIALSPDATQVAYIVKGEISVIPVAGGTSHTISIESKLQLRDLAWSPDSKRLAFIADLPGD